MGALTATSLVVASMVGTGVFTTAGLLTTAVPSAPGMIACWAVAGVASLCGALAYAELGAAYAASGGEYLFLSRLMHPSVGFLSAFTSLIVGFSAPLAAIALAFGTYLQVLVPSVSPRVAGAVLIVVLSLLNIWNVSLGARFQNVTTIGKIALIVGFIALGIARGQTHLLSEGAPVSKVLFTPGFAVGLIIISFAYTGWNAAAYVAGEVRDPARVLPRALVGGTLLVTLLYVGLNVVFLSAAPLPELAGDVVAHVAAVKLFGDAGALWLDAIIAAGLVSTVGAIAISGPRIYEAVGRDFPALRALARRRPGGGPVNAVAVQAVLAIAMLTTASFEELFTYIGFTLSFFGALTVGCVFLLRRSGHPRPYSMPGYPFTPLFYVALMVWMMVAGVMERPVIALYGLGTLAAGMLLYLVAGNRSATVERDDHR